MMGVNGCLLGYVNGLFFMFRKNSTAIKHTAGQEIEIFMLHKDVKLLGNFSDKT